jgi:hypothetical protein
MDGGVRFSENAPPGGSVRFAVGVTVGVVFVVMVVADFPVQAVIPDMSVIVRIKIPVNTQAFLHFIFSP